VSELRAFPLDVDSLRLELALHCKVVATQVRQGG